jgi:hypothetical protein
MRLPLTAALFFLGFVASMPASIPAAAAGIPARRAYEFVDSMGLCTHFGWRKSPYETAYDDIKAAIADLGMRYVRQRPGSPVSMQHLGDLNQSMGVRLEGTIDNEAEDGDFETRQLDISAIPETVRKAFQTLGSKTIVAFEGPNEYDNSVRFGDNANWARDLRSYMNTLYGTVKNDPQTRAIPVVAPSLAQNNADIFGALGDLSAVADYGNLHAYSGERPLGIALDEFIDLANMVTPGKPIIISEYGWTTASKRWQSHPITDRVKAKYIARAMAAVFTRPVIERAFIYQLVDAHANPGQDVPQRSMGLIGFDLSRKPAYYAVRNMMQLLCDAEPGFTPQPLQASLSGKLQNVRSFLVQKASGVYDLVLWQEVLSYDAPKPRNNLQGRDLSVPAQTVTVTFSQPIAGVRTYLPSALDGDADGGRKPKSSFEKPESVTLNVPDEVLIVEIIPAGVEVPRTPTSCQFTPGRR